MPDPIALELRHFVKWMYEEGPDPNAVTRERLLAAYAEARADIIVTEMPETEDDRAA